jgi:hypothetical protein
VAFRPDYVILHSGHNDVVFHPKYNPKPQHIKHFFHVILEFLHLLEENHPTARVIYSSLLPRGASSRMSEGEKDSYNRLACRFGVRATTSCQSEGFMVLQNFCMWKSVRQSIEDVSLLDEDGLHLNPLGKKTLIQFWIDTIANDFLWYSYGPWPLLVTVLMR